MTKITGVPNGFTKLEVYEAYYKDDLLVLLGEPGENHNCDLMGCGSVSNHVIAYAHLQTRDWPDPLTEKLTNIRNLARTGLPVSGMTTEQWNTHRLNTIAGELTRLIESL